MTQFKPKSIRLDRRHWRLGIHSALKWMKKPVSEEGATQVARFTIALDGPRLLGEVNKMRNHPVGRKLLKEKPDLSVAISTESLATMPEGSFGHIYYELSQQADTVPGYLLGGLVYRDGFYEALDVDEDTAWFLERINFDHDASHILSGYSTDMAGEALNILFILGHTGSVPRHRRFLNTTGLIALLFKTRIGFRQWERHLTAAYDRGVRAAKKMPHCCIPYEDLLPKSIEEVRAYLGIDPLPESWDSSDWYVGKDPYADIDPADLEAQAVTVSLAERALEKGLDWREYMRADTATREHLHAVIEQGANLDEMRAVLQ
jgi:ubiquinone biosynthesis protein Coq4